MIEPLCPLALIYGSSKVPKVPPENLIKICEGLRFKDDLGHGQMNHDDGLIRVNAFILTALALTDCFATLATEKSL